MTPSKPVSLPPARRPKKDRGSPWLMVFVIAVVIFGIVLLVTDEFGTALLAGSRLA